MGHISVENGDGATCGVEAVELDGAFLHDRKVRLVDDKQRHEVRVIMGARLQLLAASSTSASGASGGDRSVVSSLDYL